MKGFTLEECELVPEHIAIDVGTREKLNHRPNSVFFFSFFLRVVDRCLNA